MKKILAGCLILAAVACSGQSITYKQLTNFALLRTNPIVFGGTVSFYASPLYLYNPGPAMVIYDGTNTFAYFSLLATVIGTPSGPTAITGSSIYANAIQTNSTDFHVEGVAYDQNNVPFASQRYASNAVQVVAGAGTIVTASGSGGVETYTITSTAGAGATNAISAVSTNGAIGGLGLTSLGVNNGYGNTVAGVSNNGAFTLTFTVDFTGPTNYANSLFTSLSNFSSTLAYQIGANATNFGYQIGANGTSYVNAATVNITNALNAKQDGYANLSALGNSGIQFPGTAMIESNLNQIFWNLQRMTVATNSSTSNLVINVRTNKYYFTATNNLTVTNLTGIAEGVASDTTIIIEPQLIPRGITYPTLGGASFGIYANTNDNSQMWTTLTNGNRYALTISAFGTNTFWSISRWK